MLSIAARPAGKLWKELARIDLEHSKIKVKSTIEIVDLYKELPKDDIKVEKVAEIKDYKIIVIHVPLPVFPLLSVCVLHDCLCRLRSFLNVSFNPRPSGEWLDTPSCFLQMSQKRQRGAPPFLAHLFIQIFPHM